MNHLTDEQGFTAWRALSQTREGRDICAFLSGIYFERKELELLVLRMQETAENKLVRDEILKRVRERYPQ